MATTPFDISFVELADAADAAGRAADAAARKAGLQPAGLERPSTAQVLNLGAHRRPLRDSRTGRFVSTSSKAGRGARRA